MAISYVLVEKKFLKMFINLQGWEVFLQYQYDSSIIVIMVLFLQNGEFFCSINITTRYCEKFPQLENCLICCTLYMYKLKLQA